MHAGENRIELGDGTSLEYDYLVVATGPELAFDEIEGFGPERNTSSICDVDHATAANNRWEEFCKNPGPIVVGAVQGASCFGPAYEFAMIMDTDLRKRRIRDKVPMTFVTAEPYIGHLGVGGVGDTKGVLESEMRQRHIKWIVNAKVDKVEPTRLRQRSRRGRQAEKDPRAAVQVLDDDSGLPRHRGGARHRGPDQSARLHYRRQASAQPEIPQRVRRRRLHRHRAVEQTAVPVGVPKTGYMIESMVTRDRFQHWALGARQQGDARSDLERDLSRRLRRFRRGFRRHAAKSAAQRQLGVERDAGSCRQSGVRKILPAQGPRRHDGALLKKW